MDTVFVFNLTWGKQVVEKRHAFECNPQGVVSSQNQAAVQGFQGIGLGFEISQ
jgi:hypothetical protein